MHLDTSSTTDPSAHSKPPYIFLFFLLFFFLPLPLPPLFTAKARAFSSFSWIISFSSLSSSSCFPSIPGLFSISPSNTIFRAFSSCSLIILFSVFFTPASAPVAVVVVADDLFPVKPVYQAFNISTSVCSAPITGFGGGGGKPKAWAFPASYLSNWTTAFALSFKT